MAISKERPTFMEGEILGAAKLNDIVDFGRARQGRHDRFHHSWGIAEGLALTFDAGNVLLEKGVAVDRYGREIIVPRSFYLDKTTFSTAGVLQKSKPKVWYPVFLVGATAPDPDVVEIPGACGPGSSGAVTVEEYSIDFGSPGEHLLELLDAAKVGQGIAGDGETGAGRVLLGFVRWENGSFAEAAGEDPTSKNKVGPRFAGVRADEIQARGSRLRLEVGTRAEAGRPLVVVEKDPKGESELAFGLDDGKGGMTKVFTVSGKGDVTVTGKLSSPLTSGVHVESGVAFDGTLIPLPSGITDKQVQEGKAFVHIHVTPRYGGVSPPSTTDQTPLPVECVVVERRVRCRFEWDNITKLPGACDFTVLVFVPPEKDPKS